MIRKWEFLSVLCVQSHAYRLWVLHQYIQSTLLQAVGAVSMCPVSNHMLTDCGCCISVSSHTLTGYRCCISVSSVQSHSYRLWVLYHCGQSYSYRLCGAASGALGIIHLTLMQQHQLEYIIKIFYKKLNFGRLPWNRFLLASGMIENVYCSLNFPQCYHAVLTPAVVTKIKLTEDTVLDQNGQQKNS